MSVRDPDTDWLPGLVSTCTEDGWLDHWHQLFLREAAKADDRDPERMSHTFTKRTNAARIIVALIERVRQLAADTDEYGDDCPSMAVLQREADGATVLYHCHRNAHHPGRPHANGIGLGAGEWTDEQAAASILWLLEHASRGPAAIEQAAQLVSMVLNDPDPPPLDNVLDALNHARREAQHFPKPRPCTGMTATWCPRHGDCMCTDSPSPTCPLHGETSPHPERAAFRLVIDLPDVPDDATLDTIRALPGVQRFDAGWYPGTGDPE